MLNPQFWAEDGPVFFRQAHEHGLKSFVLPSAGYLHLIPRLVAWLAAQFDPGLAPAIFAGCAALLTLYVAGLTCSKRFLLPPSFGYAVAIALVPDAGEVLLTLTNAQWILVAGLLLILISREAESWSQRGHDFLAAGLLSLTGPFCLALAPLFAWRAVQRRTWFSAALAVVVSGCAAVQASFILRFGGEAATGPISWRLLVAIPGVRVGGSLASGAWLNAHMGVVVATLLGVVTIAGLIRLAMWRDPSRSGRMALLLAFAGLLAMADYRCRADWSAVFFGAGARYFFPLQLLAMWLLVAAAMAAPKRTAFTARILLVAVVVFNFSRLREPTLRDLNWPAYAERIRNGNFVTVPINPEGWSFSMPICYPSRPSVMDSPSASATALPPVPPVAPAVLNTSSRGFASTVNPVILGFVLPEGPPRTFLVRAVGPSLAKLGVPQTLSHPHIVLLKDGSPDPSFIAARPHESPAATAATTACGAFALAANSEDMIGLSALTRGNYSVIVSPDRESEAGTVLVEVYEVPAF